MKQAIISAFLGRLRDRFCEYQEPLTIAQKLEAMARIPGVAGAEVVFPYEVDPPDVMRHHLDRLRLEVSAVNVNIKADPAFVNGALASPDEAVRAKAVGFIREAKDYAASLGVPQVTCCPLSDGYDYSFHTHYARAWERMVAAVREAVAYRPEITLLLEYKPSETRVHCLLDSAAKAVLLCHAVGASNVGVTVDVGHSLYGGETPAEAVAHVAMSGYPYYVHINDNNGRWDWDLMAGTCNLWAYAEMLFYLKEFGYDGWITSDTSPVRQDAIETFSFNVRLTARIWKWLDTVDRDFIRGCLERNEAMPVLKLLEGAMFQTPAAGANA
jgi:xylose isomerase